MAEEMFLGVDVGTTSLKAGLFGANGRQLDSFSAAHPTRRTQPGWVEQDPDNWVDLIRAALAGFAAKRDLSGLKSIGITSQVNTHIFVDQAGQALTPAIIWQDGRCAEVAAALDAQISADDRIDWWGAPMPIDASHCLARMKWVADNEPEIWNKTKWVMLPKDYCILKLTGEAVTDPISNIGMVDLGLNYIPKLLDMVPGSAEKLPRLARDTDIAGVVKQGQVAENVPVAVSTMDAWSGICGVGVNAPGEAFYLSGTSEVLGVVSEDITPTPGILVFPKVGDMRVHVGPTQSGGASVLWYCDLFDITPKQMAELVEATDQSNSAPLFLPHLQGERAPLWDIDARGTLLGMNANTGKAEIARAVYEGVAFSARLLARSLEGSSGGEITSFNCGGGGFQSDVWNQIRADVLGVPLKRTNVSDPGVLGAAIMSAVAAGLYPDLGAALAQVVAFDRTYLPDPAQKTRYDAMFQLYQDAYFAARDINHKLASF